MRSSWLYECRNAGASTHVCKYASMQIQVCKYVNLQVIEYANT